MPVRDRTGPSGAVWRTFRGRVPDVPGPYDGPSTAVWETFHGRAANVPGIRPRTGQPSRDVMTCLMRV